MHWQKWYFDGENGFKDSTDVEQMLKYQMGV